MYSFWRLYYIPNNKFQFVSLSCSLCTDGNSGVNWFRGVTLTFDGLNRWENIFKSLGMAWNHFQWRYITITHLQIHLGEYAISNFFGNLCVQLITIFVAPMLIVKTNLITIIKYSHEISQNSLKYLSLDGSSIDVRLKVSNLSIKLFFADIWWIIHSLIHQFLTCSCRFF